MNPQPQHIGGKKLEKALTIAVCVLIATVFWVFNALNNDYDATLKFPVSVKIQEKDLILAKSVPYVEVEVHGYGWYLFVYSLGFDIAPILINKTKLNYKNRLESYGLLAEIKSKLKQIEVKYIVNDTAYLEFDVVENKKIFLKLDEKSLSLPAGKWIKMPVSINPNFIICKGPKHEINTLPDTILFAIKNTYVDTYFNEHVPIYYKPSPNITSNADKVQVSFNIR